MEFLSNPETWVAAAFIIFVALAAKPIGRAIGRGLDARADRIRAQLDEARSLRDEAERLLAEQQRKQIAAVKESEAIIAHAREEAERIHRESATNLEAAFGRREKMALDKIAQAEAQAVADVRNQAVAVAVAAAARLLKENIDARKADELVDSAIVELERKLH
ncbi:MAG: F0F1 ATP synthase subunit B [Dongiaceae bacterium]